MLSIYKPAITGDYDEENFISDRFFRNAYHATQRAMQLTKDTGAKLHIINVGPLYAYPRRKGSRDFMKPGKEGRIVTFLDAHDISRLDAVVNVIRSTEQQAEITEKEEKMLNAFLKTEIGLGGVAEDILANPPCDVLVARG